MKKFNNYNRCFICMKGGYIFDRYENEYKILKCNNCGIEQKRIRGEINCQDV